MKLVSSFSLCNFNCLVNRGTRREGRPSFSDHPSFVKILIPFLDNDAVSAVTTCDYQNSALLISAFQNFRDVGRQAFPPSTTANRLAFDFLAAIGSAPELTDVCTGEAERLWHRRVMSTIDGKANVVRKINDVG